MSFREEVLQTPERQTAAESVHDMRVASRRLRAALEVFVDVFPRRTFAPMLEDVKRLADALGGVRDADVMIERLTRARSGQPPAQRQALDTVIRDLEDERQHARKSLERTIDRVEQSDFPRRFAVFVAQATL